jgi:hypothetical protein
MSFLKGILETVLGFFPLFVIFSPFIFDYYYKKRGKYK